MRLACNASHWWRQCIGGNIADPTLHEHGASVYALSAWHRTHERHATGYPLRYTYSAHIRAGISACAPDSTRTSRRRARAHRISGCAKSRMGSPPLVAIRRHYGCFCDFGNMHSAVFECVRRYVCPCIQSKRIYIQIRMGALASDRIQCHRLIGYGTMHTRNGFVRVCADMSD